jgi:hypothetical protein
MNNGATVFSCTPHSSSLASPLPQSESAEKKLYPTTVTILQKKNDAYKSETTGYEYDQCAKAYFNHMDKQIYYFSLSGNYNSLSNPSQYKKGGSAGLQGTGSNDCNIRYQAF